MRRDKVREDEGGPREDGERGQITRTDNEDGERERV